MFDINEFMLKEFTVFALMVIAAGVAYFVFGKNIYIGKTFKTKKKGVKSKK